MATKSTYLTTRDRPVELSGEVRMLTEWLDIYGVTPDRFRQRLRAGWSVVDAITRPVEAKYDSRGQHRDAEEHQRELDALDREEAELERLARLRDTPLEQLIGKERAERSRRFDAYLAGQTVYDWQHTHHGD